MRYSDWRHHLLLAGTGRAGTGVLIRYLTVLGLETHLAKHGEAFVFYGEAQAVLEEPGPRSHPPYTADARPGSCRRQSTAPGQSVRSSSQRPTAPARWPDAPTDVPLTHPQPARLGLAATCYPGGRGGSFGQQNANLTLWQAIAAGSSRAAGLSSRHASSANDGTSAARCPPCDTPRGRQPLPDLVKNEVFCCFKAADACVCK